MEKEISLQELISNAGEYKSGDKLLLSGKILTARDAAHARIKEVVRASKEMPFELKDAVVYYCGPTPAKPGYAIGSCGPTTASRIDEYTELMLSLGVKAMIGKGPRASFVKEYLKAYCALYLLATGGAGALLSGKVKKARVLAFPELGPEAVFELEVRNFPLIVAYDTHGNDIFESR